MTLTAHSLMGATVATIIPNPLVSLPICFGLHFVVDKLPHWDTMTDKGKNQQRIFLESLLDMVVGFGLVALVFVYFLHAPNPLLILSAVFVSQLPDLMEFPYIVFNSKIPVFYDSYRFQHYVHDLWFDARMKAPWGVVTQLVVVAVFLFWAFRVI